VIYLLAEVWMTSKLSPRSFLPLTPLTFQVLLALADTERHGYGIIREVDERTDGIIKLRTGTLYTLLQRLLEQSLVEGAGPPSIAAGRPGTARKDDPRRRYYALTPLGRSVVEAEAQRLARVVLEARRKQVLGRASKA
jgi:DNA-binding PadR family transcriptional regulator